MEEPPRNPLKKIPSPQSLRDCLSCKAGLLVAVCHARGRWRHSSLPLGPGCDCSVGTSVPEPSAHSCFYGPWSPGVHRRAIPNTHPAQQTASGEPKLPQARGLYSRGRQRSRLSKHHCPSCRDRAPPPLLAGSRTTMQARGRRPAVSAVGSSPLEVPLSLCALRW